MTGWRVERSEDGEAVLTFGGLPFGQGFGLVASLGEQAPVAYAALANALARDAQVQAEMQNVDCGVIAEHPCAGPCLGCGAGPDESCSGGCRCDEGEDCAISVLLEADRVPLRRIAAIHGLYPPPGDRDDSEEQR